MTLCNVGPTSKMLGRRCINVIQMFCVCWAGGLSNIVHVSNVGSMLGQRRRRWPNIKTALGQCLVWVVSCNQFSGYINAVNLYSIGYCWPTLDRPRHAHFAVEWFFNIKSPHMFKGILGWLLVVVLFAHIRGGSLGICFVCWMLCTALYGSTSLQQSSKGSCSLLVSGYNLRADCQWRTLAPPLSSGANVAPASVLALI